MGIFRLVNSHQPIGRKLMLQTLFMVFHRIHFFTTPPPKNARILHLPCGNIQPISNKLHLSSLFRLRTITVYNKNVSHHSRMIVDDWQMGQKKKLKTPTETILCGPLKHWPPTARKRNIMETHNTGARWLSIYLYIYMLLMLRRKGATDVDCIIFGAPGPNDWRGTDFTSSEIPAKTPRQLGSTHTLRKKDKRNRKGEADKLGWKKRRWKPRLISHECAEVAAYALHWKKKKKKDDVSSSLLLCVFLLSSPQSVNGQVFATVGRFSSRGHGSCRGFLMSR